MAAWLQWQLFDGGKKLSCPFCLLNPKNKFLVLSTKSLLLMCDLICEAQGHIPTSSPWLVSSLRFCRMTWDWSLLTTIIFNHFLCISSIIETEKAQFYDRHTVITGAFKCNNSSRLSVNVQIVRIKFILNSISWNVLILLMSLHVLHFKAQRFCLFQMYSLLGNLRCTYLFYNVKSDWETFCYFI